MSTCLCHLVPQGMKCITCWAADGYHGAKNGWTGEANKPTLPRRFCMDCGDEVIESERCRRCATRVGTEKYWEEWRRERRTPLRERFGPKKVGA